MPLLLSPLVALAQAAPCVSGTALDPQNLPVSNLTITWHHGPAADHARTGPDGHFAFSCLASSAPAGQLTIDSTVFTAAETIVPATGTIDLHLTLSSAEQVTVTTRSSLDLLPTPLAAQTLSRADLLQYPALTLDERLRQVAGFELFRRASSWVANPTSEGVSLQGLGSTAASRTLVLLDGAPQNDGFGGWVHWNELPQDALASVDVVQGASSDLYGSSALSGVIDVEPTRPDTTEFQLGAAGASLDTSDVHGRLALHRGPQHNAWGASLAGEGFRTAGYIPIAPALQGTVDRPANVHSQAARTTLEHTATATRLFVTGNLLNEARNNGTLLQTNGTRIWRWLAADEWAATPRLSGRLRLFGSDEHYRQTFTSINTPRTTELLTRIQRPVTQEIGFTTDASLHLGPAGLVVGADLRDLRANDIEQPTTGAQAGQLQSITARQRFTGGFVEALAAAHGWSAAASLRIDSATRPNAAQQTFRPGSSPSIPQPLPTPAELLFSPRLGLSRTLPHNLLLDLGAFRGFRSPTMNELYRQGQVGQEITLANPSLQSERATGAQGGLRWSSSASGSQPRLTAQAGYFWTEVNRPVSAVLLSTTPSTITEQRQNLGQIQSQGVNLRSSWQLRPGLSFTGAYQFAHAVTTRYSAQPSLVGKWIPNVPRHSVTFQLRAASRWGELTLAGRAAGQAFDDTSNLYPLHRFFALDAFASHQFGRRISLFVSAQNLLNQRMEVARTPQLTLGNPILVQGGLNLRWPASHLDASYPD